MSIQISRTALGLTVTVALALITTTAFAQTGDPIKIGSSLPLTGGKSAADGGQVCQRREA
jgi:hypothetical protein